MLHLEYDPEAIEYPTSDGRPLGETDAHRDLILELIEALKYHFLGTPDTYVTGDLLLFYEEGQPKRFVVPDVMVIPGIAQKRRNHYKLWKEGPGPSCVIEVTSRSTRSEDLGFKKGLYEFLGVQEYLMVDPLKEYLNPSVRLFRRHQENLLTVVEHPLRLLTLGLEVRVVEEGLRLWDPAKQRMLPNLEEQRELGLKEAARAESEAARAESEAARAESEAARADRAEAEILRLRQQLASHHEG
ncbi:Uma2 family endonuclease [bacterium]|nr:Uma2 family endonuclease [bacterium]